MKKLMLTLVIMLTVSFVFAKNDVEKKFTFKFEKTVTIKFVENDFTIDSFKPISLLLKETPLCAEEAWLYGSVWGYDDWSRWFYTDLYYTTYCE